MTRSGSNGAPGDEDIARSAAGILETTKVLPWLRAFKTRYQMANFAIVGVAGYIAPRHLKAIADTGNKVVAAYDRFDSVGRLDSSFPDCAFFTEQEQFEEYVDRLKGTENQVEWLTVCTPNYTHAPFCRYGLKNGMDVICEKPATLHPSEIDELVKLEKETGHKVYNILQLRLHDSIAALKRKVDAGPADKKYNIELTYITSRGKWYYASWKGDNHKSGGIATNIGVHFYDMLQWIFGPVMENTVHISSFDRVAGRLELEKASVKYFLSINGECLPPNAVQGEKRTYRTLNIDGDEFEFSQGFTELHTRSYEKILCGEGFRIAESRNCIQIVEDIRNAVPVGLTGDFHPLALRPPAVHPFGWMDVKY